jgi:hypothetical protein
VDEQISPGDESVRPTESDFDLLMATPLFDHAWYRKGAATREDAVRSYLERKNRFRAPHPLFLPQHLARVAVDRAFRTEPLLAYLRKRNFRLAFHPLFDVDLYLSQAPAALDHPAGPLGHYLETGIGSGLRPNAWYEADEGGLVRWVREAPHAPLIDEQRRPWLHRGISIVVHGDSDVSALDQIVARVHEDATALGAEILVLAQRRDFAARGVLASFALRYPGLVVRTFTAEVPATQALDRLVGHARGRRVVLLHEESRPLSGWLHGLLGALEEHGVVAAQSLLLDERGVIRDSGRVLEGGTAVPILTGLPPEDARGSSVTRRAGLSTGALAVRRRWLRSALQQPPVVARGTGVVVPTSLVELAQDGSEVLRLRAEGAPSSGEVLAASGLESRSDGRLCWIGRPGASPDALRWAIKTPAPFSDNTRSWGDTHFAQSLAQSLRGLGQQVAVDHRPAIGRETAALDQVVVVLRGGVRVAPVPGAVNILWIISRPNWVGADEMRGFDVVCAASPTWARERSEEWGIPIVPLLQATDTERFHPGVPRADPGFDWLFVGNAYEENREIVFAALAAGLPLSVFGRSWPGRIPEECIAGSYFPNERLGSAYASAAVVLNDHKEDMRTAGFLSNRLFDAAAVGARVLTDDVAGLHEVFGESVRSLAEVGDLSSLAEADLDRIFGSEGYRRACAEAVCSEHSFDKRAEQLLVLAQEARDRGGRQPQS